MPRYPKDGAIPSTSTNLQTIDANIRRSIQEAEESYRDLQKILGEIYRKMKISDENITSDKSLVPRTSKIASSTSGSKQNVNPHLHRNASALEKELSEIRDTVAEFYPKLTSSKKRISAEKELESTTSSSSTLPVIEGTLMSELEETLVDESNDSQSTLKWHPDDDYVRNGLAIKNRKLLKGDDLMNEKNDNVTIPIEKIQSKKREDNRNEQEKKLSEKQNVETTKAKTDVPHSNQKTQKRILQANDTESNDFVCKTIIVQTVRKYPPYSVSNIPYKVPDLMRSYKTDNLESEKSQFSEMVYDPAYVEEEVEIFVKDPLPKMETLTEYRETSSGLFKTNYPQKDYNAAEENNA